MSRIAQYAVQQLLTKAIDDENVNTCRSHDIPLSSSPVSRKNLVSFPSDLPVWVVIENVQGICHFVFHVSWRTVTESVHYL